jgi:hypothetical protein
MKVKVIDILVYILFYGHTLSYDTQWKIILTILLTIFQFVKLENRIDNIKIKRDYENKN